MEEQHLKYRTTLVRSGVPQLADILPRYLNRSKPDRPVTRNNSVTGPGVGALLAQLIWAICDEGDGVLIATVCHCPRSSSRLSNISLISSHITVGRFDSLI